MSLHGSLNHVSITVADIEAAMEFFGPLLEFLGYSIGAISSYKDHRLAFNLNEANGIAVNVWEATVDHQFEVYEPGLHHIAFNVSPKSKVDEASKLIEKLGGEILDGPDEFPFAQGGYYAVYFLGPDGLTQPSSQSNHRQYQCHR